GSLSDYRPRPFVFFLTKAELAEESMPVAGGACADPRPKMCTQEHRPACGTRKDGSRKTYGNACSACADAEVVTQAEETQHLAAAVGAHHQQVGVLAVGVAQQRTAAGPPRYRARIDRVDRGV